MMRELMRVPGYKNNDTLIFHGKTMILTVGSISSANCKINPHVLDWEGLSRSPDPSAAPVDVANLRTVFSKSTDTSCKDCTT